MLKREITLVHKGKQVIYRHWTIVTAFKRCVSVAAACLKRGFTFNWKWLISFVFRVLSALTAVFCLNKSSSSANATSTTTTAKTTATTTSNWVRLQVFETLEASFWKHALRTSKNFCACWILFHKHFFWLIVFSLNKTAFCPCTEEACLSLLNA